MKIKLFTVPNLLTIANLLCGAFATVMALRFNDPRAAFWLIVAAAGFDFLDGLAARLLRSVSPVGVQLDSLCDVISFGLAPAAMMYMLWDGALCADAGAWVRYGGAAVCFALAAFAALRLAKFNVDTSQSTEFHGLPVPANALFFASLAWIAPHASSCEWQWVILFVPLFSWLMICDMPMFSLKFHGFGWRGNAVRYSFLMVSAAMLALAWALRGSPVYAVPLIITLYIAVSGCFRLFCKKK